MAEGKSGGAGLFAKQVQKRFSRAQEKVRPGPPHPHIPYFIFPLSFSQGEGKGGTEGLLLLGTAQHPWVLLGRYLGHLCALARIPGQTSPLLQGSGCAKVSPKPLRVIW